MNILSSQVKILSLKMIKRENLKMFEQVFKRIMQDEWINGVNQKKDSDEDILIKMKNLKEALKSDGWIEPQVKKNYKKIKRLKSKKKITIVKNKSKNSSFYF